MREVPGSIPGQTLFWPCLNTLYTTHLYLCLPVYLRRPRATIFETPGWILLKPSLALKRFLTYLRLALSFTKGERFIKLTLALATMICFVIFYMCESTNLRLCKANSKEQV
ncbi:hypothetical protein F5X98DRAFT_5234 [Xylaria grammica]|nr:hypothetical protein F5X98DRAFT_5234 [Xylaria grammica]